MMPLRLITALATLMMGVPGCSGPAREWSPEQATLLFMSKHEGNAEIYLKDGPDGTWRNLTRNPAADNWPVWSPDGTRIAFQSARNGKLDIWLMQADGSDPVRLTDHEDHDYLPAWTPDGQSICFTSWRMEAADTVRAPHFYRMRADGSEQRRLTDTSPMTSTGMEWSPDGKSVVYTRKTEHGGALVVAETQEWTERQLTDGHDYCGSAVFSPDGVQIACYAANDSASEIIILNADGSGRRTVVRGGWNYYPRYSPDGRWLLYCAAVPEGTEDDYDIFAVALDGSAGPVLLAGGPGRQVEGNWDAGP